jgi:uncharacterized protein (TIGR00297 family)
MAAFFGAGTAATRAGYRAKARRGIAQERGGARGWRSAWANGAVPAVLALAALAAPSGARELWVLAYAASVATAAADTCASEIGKACAGRTVSVASGRTVPPGTEGGISLEGTLGGLAGAALVAGVGAATGLHGTAAAVVVGLAGVLGTLAESALGALAGGHLGDDLLNVINTALGGAIAVLLAMALR